MSQPDDAVVMGCFLFALIAAALLLGAVFIGYALGCHVTNAEWREWCRTGTCYSTEAPPR